MAASTAITGITVATMMVEVGVPELEYGVLLAAVVVAGAGANAAALEVPKLVVVAAGVVEAVHAVVVEEAEAELVLPNKPAASGAANVSPVGF